MSCRTVITASLLAVCALSMPALGQPPRAEQILEEARSSPLFVAELDARDLEARGLASVEIDEGVHLELGEYLERSSFEQQPRLQPLFEDAIRSRYLDEPAREAPPRIVQLEDRVVIHRELEVDLKEGLCRTKTRLLPDAVADLCFRHTGGPIPPEMARDLAQLRRRLAARASTQVFRGATTVGEASRMTDEDLLYVLLNEGTRTIRRTTVVPLRSVRPTQEHRLRDFNRPLRVRPDRPRVRRNPVMRRILPSATQARAAKPVSRQRSAATSREAEPPIDFDKEYFLTGDTWGHLFEDTLEYTFSEETLLTDRYYVSVSYSFGGGVGLRLPFSVAVSTRSAVRLAFASDTLPVVVPKRLVTLAVAPENGTPQIYDAVGLPSSQHFGGNELVLEARATCSFYASIPGPDLSYDCPIDVDESASADFDPVLGATESKITDLWLLPASVTGLGLDVEIAHVGVDVGIDASMTGGRIGLRLSPLDRSELLRRGEAVPSSVDYWFEREEPERFTVGPTNNQRPFGFSVGRPRYAFSVELAPSVRVKGGLDVGPYDESFEWPFTFPIQWTTPELELPLHPGTSEAYRYSF